MNPPERFFSPPDTSVYVDLANRSYEIHIGSDTLVDAAKHLEEWVDRASDFRGTRKALIVTDGNVLKPHAVNVERSLTDAGWTTTMFTLQPGEQSKRMSEIEKVYDALVEQKADRKTVVIAVGGGVVGDAAGFAAATYVRGLPFVQVPTTLLAQVDSSVGGKVGINHPKGKNLIGAFHQPLGVLIDTATLDTLPNREYRSGMAEVIKYGVILDREFLEYLEENKNKLDIRHPEILQHVIARSCRLKADVVEEDEFERSGLRAVLNYGHTFAHAYEALVGYGELLHGEAVAIGMVHASQLAEKQGLIDAEATERQIALLEAAQLPTSLPERISLSPDDILSVMRLDKKAIAGKLRFVLPTRLGHVELFGEVPEEDVREVLEQN